MAKKSTTKKTPIRVTKKKTAKKTAVLDEVDAILDDKGYVGKSDVDRMRGKEPKGPPTVGRLKGGKTQEKTITIPTPNFHKFQVAVTNVDVSGTAKPSSQLIDPNELDESDGSLIVNAWSTKAIRQMLSEHMGVVTKKSKKLNREKKNAYQDFMGTLYTDKRGYFAFPSIAFKNAMTSACRLVPNVTMVDLMQCVHVVGHLSPLYGFPNNRLDMVQIGTPMNRVPDIRFRAEFPKWMVILTIRHDADVITQEQVLRLLVRAGMTVGVGEWRLENRGVGGAFDLLQPAQVKKLMKKLGRYTKDDLNLENTKTLEILRRLELEENYMEIFVGNGHAEAHV